MKRKSNTKARPNELQLFHLYPNGFVSFGKWLNYHRRMHGRHPLGCLHFGEEWLQRWEAVGRLLGKWIKDRIWELLQKPCELESNVVGDWLVVGYHKSTARALAELAKSHSLFLGSLRVVLLDGTIIKEWSAK